MWSSSTIKSPSFLFLGLFSTFFIILSALTMLPTAQAESCPSGGFLYCTSDSSYMTCGSQRKKNMSWFKDMQPQNTTLFDPIALPVLWSLPWWTCLLTT
ncbi:MAG: hypothetical protein J3R72DRAFT_444636 [Linnemannia gamsii]|nr:MAG: hypothetical protein J3R72DRAFT_444636 [Linnemannia gamsii]